MLCLLNSRFREERRGSWSLRRVFWPGLLSIIGTGTFFGLAFFFITLPFNLSEGVGPGYGGLVPAVILGAFGVTVLAFAIMLLVDPVHQIIWGAGVELLYGLASYFLVPDLLFSLSSFNTLDPLRSAGAVMGLVLGLAGGALGLLLKTPRIHS